MLRCALQRAVRAGRRPHIEFLAAAAPQVTWNAAPGACGISSTAGRAAQEAGLAGAGAEASAASAVASAGDQLFSGGGFRPATAGPQPQPGAAGAQGGEVVPWDSLNEEQFRTVADWFMGRLWMRIERGLREAGPGGEDWTEYDLKSDHGAMRISLPSDGQLMIRKDVEARALVVESNLYEPWEDKDTIEFRLKSEDEWVNEDGELLEEFLASAFSRYLKTRVCL